MLFWPKTWNEKLPSSLAALIFVVILNEILCWDLVLVASIPQSLLLDERLHLSAFTHIPLRNIAIVSYVLIKILSGKV